ncbi:MAG: hypothetical protein ACRC53_11500 [Plesiomonas sp.]
MLVISVKFATQHTCPQRLIDYLLHHHLSALLTTTLARWTIFYVYRLG